MNVLSELFATIIKEAFYDSLRTKQQLGKDMKFIYKQREQEAMWGSKISADTDL